MLPGKQRTIIGVMGGSDPHIPSSILDQAETTGRLIAESGALLLCGGRTGIMEAVARGAKGVPWGETLAILPGSDPEAANPYMDIVVATGMGNGRNIINVLSSDAIIAFPGGPGTLSEIALAIKSGIHTIGCSSWDMNWAQNSIWGHGWEKQFHIAPTPEEAVKLALRFARKPVLESKAVHGEILKLFKERLHAWNRLDPSSFILSYLASPALSVVINGRILRGMGEVTTYFKEFLGPKAPKGHEITIDASSLTITPLSGHMALAFSRFAEKGKEEGRASWICSSVLVRHQETYRIMAEHFTRPDVSNNT